MNLCRQARGGSSTESILLFIVDVWRQYLEYQGIDLKQQLVISNNIDLNMASVVIDKNSTSCLMVEPCYSGKFCKK